MLRTIRSSASVIPSAITRGWNDYPGIAWESYFFFIEEDDFLSVYAETISEEEMIRFVKDLQGVLSSGEIRLEFSGCEASFETDYDIIITPSEVRAFMKVIKWEQVSI